MKLVVRHWFRQLAAVRSGKTIRVASNQIGLTDVIAKYRLLAQSEPVISDDNGYFTVVLPLLSPVSL
ncbi:hypothetical protein ACFSUS_11610 [Spirosoma soli]|uniref:Sensor histidine kinase n=1 Tax=Spirosoma soli TaxID=1770529 RepID=A0ABW5M2M2_9BACT